jgi:hypothetical protein
VVDAALARRVQTVSLRSCVYSPASAPALARLLAGDALTSLRNVGEGLLMDAPAARALAAPLRANSTLTSLTLTNAGVFIDVAVAAELLGALNGHASLQVLNLGVNFVDAAHQAAAGALLGALLAANAPALIELDVSDCWLGDDGMRPLFEALPHNSHLRELVCSCNGISAAFAADVCLSALWMPSACVRWSRRCRTTRTCGRCIAPVTASVTHLRLMCCCQRCSLTRACARWLWTTTQRTRRRRRRWCATVAEEAAAAGQLLRLRNTLSSR